MDGGIEEGVGESSSPARGTGGLGAHDIKDEIYHRLVEDGHADASDPDFRDRFDAHFARLPSSYRLDLNVERAEDVLLHQRILDDARNTDGRPVYHARFMKLEENLDAENINDLEDGEDLTDASSARQDVTCIPIHEIIFSTVDKPKLLSQVHVSCFL